MNELEVIQVIHTRLLRRGDGRSEADPVRIIDQYWLLDGSLLFAFDMYTGEMTSFVHRSMNQMPLTGVSP